VFPPREDVLAEGFPRESRFELAEALLIACPQQTAADGQENLRDDTQSYSSGTCSLFHMAKRASRSVTPTGRSGNIRKYNESQLW